MIDIPGVLVAVNEQIINIKKMFFVLPIYIEREYFIIQLNPNFTIACM